MPTCEAFAGSKHQGGKKGNGGEFGGWWDQYCANCVESMTELNSYPTSQL